MRQVQIIRPDGRPIIVSGGTNAPRSEAELAALHRLRSELTEQYGALRRRRNELDEQRHITSGPQRASLEARIAEVDMRQAALESQIDGINQRIASADPRAFISITEPPRHPFVNKMADNMLPLAGMFSVFFMLPLAIAFARLLWKRGSAVGERPAINEAAMMARLDQLQTSMDAMSVEVERISEGQRYVTKLMGEKERLALPR